MDLDKRIIEQLSEEEIAILKEVIVKCTEYMEEIDRLKDDIDIACLGIKDTLCIPKPVTKRLIKEHHDQMIADKKEELSVLEEMYNILMGEN